MESRTMARTAVRRMEGNRVVTGDTEVAPELTKTADRMTVAPGESNDLGQLMQDSEVGDHYWTLQVATIDLQIMAPL